MQGNSNAWKTLLLNFNLCFNGPAMTTSFFFSLTQIRTRVTGPRASSWPPCQLHNHHSPWFYLFEGKKWAGQGHWLFQLSLTHAHAHTHARTHSHALYLTHTHKLAHAPSLSLIYTLLHPCTYTHSLSLSLSLSLMPNQKGKACFFPGFVRLSKQLLIRLGLLWLHIMLLRQVR